MSGSHLDVARWDGWSGARTTWESNRDGPAYLDGVRWVPILDDRERAAALERGEVDCIQNASLLDVDRLAANPELEVIEFQQSALVYMGARPPHESLGDGDVRVRRAISLAIDRQALVDRDLDGPRLAGGLADPVALAVVRAGGRVVAAASTRARRPSCSTRPASQPAPDGVRLELRDGRRQRRDGAPRRGDDRARCSRRSASGSSSTVIQAFDEFYGRLNEHPPAFISKWFWPEPVDAIVGFVATWGQDGGPNFQRSSDEALDRACRAWEVARDDDALRAAARDIQLRAAECLPLIPLFAPAAVWAHHRRVRDWRPNRHDLYPLYGDVWLADGTRRRHRDVRCPGRSEAEEVVRPDLLRRHVARGDRRLPRQPRQRPGSAASACSRRTAGPS